jgi:NMT1-like family
MSCDGDALAKILTEKLDIAVNPLPSQGPVHNVKLIESGGIQLGLITMGMGLQAWNGSGDWTKGQKFRNMRALFPMYDTPFHFVVLQRSAINSIADFNNKNVGIGPSAGTGGTYIPAVGAPEARRKSQTPIIAQNRPVVRLVLVPAGGGGRERLSLPAATLNECRRA